MWTFRVANSIKERVKEVATPYIDDLVADVNSMDEFSRSIVSDEDDTNDVHRGVLANGHSTNQTASELFSKPQAQFEASALFDHDAPGISESNDNLSNKQQPNEESFDWQQPVEQATSGQQQGGHVANALPQDDQATSGQQQDGHVANALPQDDQATRWQQQGGHVANALPHDDQTTNWQQQNGQLTNALPHDGQTTNWQQQDGQVTNALPHDGQTTNWQQQNGHVANALPHDDQVTNWQQQTGHLTNGQSTSWQGDEQPTTSMQTLPSVGTQIDPGPNDFNATAVNNQSEVTNTWEQNGVPQVSEGFTVDSQHNARAVSEGNEDALSLFNSQAPPSEQEPATTNSSSGVLGGATNFAAAAEPEPVVQIDETFVLDPDTDQQSEWLDTQHREPAESYAATNDIHQNPVDDVQTTSDQLPGTVPTASMNSSLATSKQPMETFSNETTADMGTNGIYGSEPTLDNGYGYQANGIDQNHAGAYNTSTNNQSVSMGYYPSEAPGHQLPAHEQEAWQQSPPASSTLQSLPLEAGPGVGEEVELLGQEPHGATAETILGDAQVSQTGVVSQNDATQNASSIPSVPTSSLIEGTEVSRHAEGVPLHKIVGNDHVTSNDTPHDVSRTRELDGVPRFSSEDLSDVALDDDDDVNLGTENIHTDTTDESGTVRQGALAVAAKLGAGLFSAIARRGSGNSDVDPSPATTQAMMNGEKYQLPVSNGDKQEVEVPKSEEQVAWNRSLDSELLDDSSEDDEATHGSPVTPPSVSKQSKHEQKGNNDRFVDESSLQGHESPFSAAFRGTYAHLERLKEMSVDKVGSLGSSTGVFAKGASNQMPTSQSEAKPSQPAAVGQLINDRIPNAEQSESLKVLLKLKGQLDQADRSAAETLGYDLEPLVSDLNSLISIRKQLDEDEHSFRTRLMNPANDSSLDDDIAGHWDIIKMQDEEERTFLLHFEDLQSKGVLSSTSERSGESNLDAVPDSNIQTLKNESISHTEIQNLNNEIERLNALIVDHTKQSQELKQELSEVMSQSQDLSSKYHMLEQRNQQLESKHSKVENEKYKLEEQVALLESQNQKLNKQVNETVSNSGDQVSSLHHQLSSCQLQLSQQMQEVARLTTELQNSNSAAIQWQERSNAFESMVSELRKAGEQTQHDLVEAKAKQQNSEARWAMDKSALEHEVETLKAQVAEYTTQSKQFGDAEEEIISRLDQLLNDGVDKVDAALEAFDEMKITAKHIQEERETIETKLHQVEAEFQRSRKRLEFLQSSEAKLKETKESDEEAISKFEAAISKLNSASEAMHQELHRCEQVWGELVHVSIDEIAEPEALTAEKQRAENERRALTASMMNRLCNALKPENSTIAVLEMEKTIQQNGENCPPLLANQAISLLNATHEAQLNLLESQLAYKTSLGKVLSDKVDSLASQLAELKSKLISSERVEPIDSSTDLKPSSSSEWLLTIVEWALDRSKHISWIKDNPESSQVLQFAQDTTSKFASCLKNKDNTSKEFVAATSTWKSSIMSLANEMQQKAPQPSRSDSETIPHGHQHTDTNNFKEEFNKVLTSTRSLVLRELNVPATTDTSMDDKLLGNVENFGEQFANSLTSVSKDLLASEFKRLNHERDEAISLAKLMVALSEVCVLGPNKENTTAAEPESALDKRLIASLVVTCVEHNCRLDCLEVIGKALEFTPEERKRVGLEGAASIWDNIIPGWSRSEAKAKQAKDFSTAWSDFVMDETS